MTITISVFIRKPGEHMSTQVRAKGHAMVMSRKSAIPLGILCIAVPIKFFDQLPCWAQGMPSIVVHNAE